MFTTNSNLALRNKSHLIELSDKPIPFITYGSGNSSRDITIIAGQPYYKSSGLNSGSRDTWFPFFMMVGTQVRKIKHTLLVPNELDRGISEIFFSPNINKVNESYFIKADPENLNDKFNQIIQFESITRRISTKRDLINSIRLGKGMWNDQALYNKAINSLNLNERKVAKTPISLQHKTSMTTHNSDEVNEWLLANGATVINKLYELNEIPKSRTSRETSQKIKFIKLKRMLSEYIALRQKEQESIVSFFYDMGKYDHFVKLKAANKLMDWFNGRSVVLTHMEFGALHEGRLEKIFSDIEQTEFYKIGAGRLQAQQVQNTKILGHKRVWEHVDPDIFMHHVSA